MQIPLLQFFRYVLLCVLLLTVIVATVCAESGNADLLTPAERAWFTKNHSQIVLAVETGYPPFVFLDSSDHPIGLAHDYLQRLESKLGVSFPQKRFSTLDEIFTKVRSGDVKIVNAVTKTPKRSGFLSFTEPFISLPNVIIVRKEHTGQMREKELAGLKVSLVKSYAVTEQLTKQGPAFIPDLVANDTEALLNVSFGRSDAAVIDLATASYLIVQKGITNLQVAGETSTGIQLSLGVAHAETTLLNILQKGLAAITEDERQEINSHWISISRPNMFSDRRFWIASGGVVFVICVLIAGILLWNRTLQRQVTARTAALANEKAFLRSLLDSANDLIYFKDSNGIYLGCNKASELFTGIPESKQIGKSDFDLFDHEKAQEIVRYDRMVFEGGAARRTEEWVALPHAAEVLLDTVKTPIYGSDGQAIGLVGISRDITEQRKAEQEKLDFQQQFQQTQKLESLGVLAGGIAHDFNNILTIIIGHCSLAMMNPVTAETRIPVIEKAAERAAELCRQMLAYAGKAQFVTHEVNFGELVDEMVKMLKVTINQKASVSVNIAADLPSIRADASQLRQIVMNLVINAAEAIGEEQGEIRVALSRKEITVVQAERDHLGVVIAPGWYLCLEVSDTGCGMDEETRRRVFEPFYTTKFTGRGLGMSATLGIISAHNGALQLFSQTGCGTTFKVYLPINSPADDQSVQELAAVEGWLGSGTILLVEDEEEIRLLAATMLQRLGFTVIEACDGRQALDLYRQYAAEIRLVLTDIGMPVMDGYELLGELKKLTPELPVIFSSGFGEADVASHLQPGDVAGCIGKPYNFEQLRDVLKECSDKVT
jgi:PAS domain S-box-containing protein